MSRGAAVERVLSALRAHGSRIEERGPDAWMAQCPAEGHDDRTASLSVAQGDKGAVVCCQRGCDTGSAVLPPLKLSLRGLFDQPGKAAARAPRRVVTEYRYTGERGELLFVKVRFEPKGFSQKRPDGRGGWIWNLSGVPRTLYRLPEVLAAVRDGKTVFLVEGEMDADRLVGMGLTATCNFDGAAEEGKRAKWHPEYGDALRGADVVIIADRDAAGVAHARAAAADLAGKAKSVAVMQTAASGEGADVSDHLDAGYTLNELVPLANPEPAAAAPDVGDADSGRGPSQATRLVTLAIGVYEFGVTPAGDAFAVPRKGGRVVRMLRGGRPALRPELSAAMYAEETTAPNGSALTDALSVIEGIAQQQDPTELALRTARHEDSLLLDLGDVTGRTVRITQDGWQVIDRAPVLFRRTGATMPLPEPIGGSSLDDTLFRLLNIAKEDRPLMKAVLVHYLWPDIAHVITRLTGRDGVAKTWATRIMRSLIDPSAAPTRAIPKEETDWIVAVNAALIAAIDNVSSLPDWLSDAMCRAATGEGLMRRKLFSDQDVSILSARRIVILNGIDATIRNADFARRTVDFELQQIARIKSDSEVAAEWASTHPHALGALLDAAVLALRGLPDTRLAGAEQSLTMGDFAQIAKATDEQALKLYMRRLGTAAADVLDASPFAGALIGFIGRRPHGRWNGLASDLVQEEIPAPSPLPKGWPQDPTRFGVWVKRYGRVLESAARIRVTKETRTAQGQPYTIERITDEEDPSATVGKSATSTTQLHGDAVASDNVTAANAANGSAQQHDPADRNQQECSRVSDVADFPTAQDRTAPDEWPVTLPDDWAEWPA